MNQPVMKKTLFLATGKEMAEFRIDGNTTTIITKGPNTSPWGRTCVVTTEKAREVYRRLEGMGYYRW